MSDNPFKVNTKSVSSDFPTRKKMHGCLTAWLILMIIANVLLAIASPTLIETVKKANPDFPVWALWFAMCMGILNVVFAAALFAWKKWGFYGFATTTIIAFGVNLYTGAALGQAFAGLGGIALLFLMLQLGGDRKAWTQLD